VLNGVSLSPKSTGNRTYDDKLESIVGSGTTYERVHRGYTWLVNNMNYEDYAPWGTTGDKYMDLAYGPLFHSQGSCKNYSAATYIMLRYIGLPNVEVVDGTIINSDGSKQYHIWNTVTIGGVRYIVDAEVEGKVYKKKGFDKIRYLYFFADPATYSENPQFLEGSRSYDDGSGRWNWLFW